MSEIIIDEILKGNRLALARILTQVENDTPQGRAILSELFTCTGKAHLIGVTGAPGTGKSTLVNQIAHAYRHPATIGEDISGNSESVAIIAIDPTSPFTGGAILGDRVRMRDLAGDPGVFIRSMATRGTLGGLARATAGMVQVLDAAGYGIILIETVGAGQAEVDIARLAHTTLVVEAPGLGDDIQAIKAGMLEIADILVVNKSDRPGADATERTLRSMLQMAHPVEHIFRHHGVIKENPRMPEVEHFPSSWMPPVHRTVAIEGTGIPELVLSIRQHFVHLKESGEWQHREQARLQTEVENLLVESLFSLWRDSSPAQRYSDLLQSVYRRSISPWQAVQQLLGVNNH